MNFAAGRPPFSRKSARGEATPGRMTPTGGTPVDAPSNLADQADALERVDNGQRLAEAMRREVMAIADPPAPVSERLVAELDRRLTDVEEILAALGQEVASDALASAVCGAVGMSAAEIRQQVPSLRQAVRDMEQSS